MIHGPKGRAVLGPRSTASWERQTPRFFFFFVGMPREMVAWQCGKTWRLRHIHESMVVIFLGIYQRVASDLDCMTRGNSEIQLLTQISLSFDGARYVKILKSVFQYLPCLCRSEMPGDSEHISCELAAQTAAMGPKISGDTSNGCDMRMQPAY